MEKNNIPKITYKKWWHRFIPSYRRNIKMMNTLLETQWPGIEKELAEKHKELWQVGFTRIGDKIFYL